MAVFRVEKNKGYTVMSNHHLRNKELSLKAKGLLSQMLSLPEDWDYTLAGLSLINREKIDAIREAVRELENAGYIQRSRERDEKGCLRGTTYVIYEQPPNSISYLFKKCIEIAILTAFSILPLLAVAAAGKNYILPVCVTLVYTFLSFILLMVNMHLHPLSSATAIIMRDIPGVILAQEVNIPAALFCIGIWTIVSIVFAYISLKHRK